MKFSALLVFVMLMLVACGGSEDETPTSTPEPAPTATTDTLSIEKRLSAEEDYEALRQLHVEISGIWESLARGETAQCGTQYDIPSPGSFSEADEIEGQLRIAASELRAAANRWASECTNPRENVPQEIIEGGLLEVRAAGDALNAVEALLSGD